MNFINDHCTPLPKNAAPLTMEVENTFVATLPEEWKLARNGLHKLEAEYVFATTQEAVHFVTQIMHIADEQNHHPDIYISYTTVRVTLWSHEIDGLSQNDFIVATKISML